jgi:hypothetical protein
VERYPQPRTSMRGAGEAGVWWYAVPRGVNRGSRALGPQPRARRRLDPSQGGWTRRRHTDGAQPLAAPLIRFARFYEASRPRPRSPLPAATGSPITGTRCGLGAGVPSQRLQGRRALTLGRSADCGAPGALYRGRRGEPLWSPRERTPQVEPAAHQASAHSRSRRSLAELGTTMAGRSRPMTYDLRLTTTCFT